MFIWLPPMGIGIMRAVSDQRMACRFYRKMHQRMKGGGTEEKFHYGDMVRWLPELSLLLDWR